MRLSVANERLLEAVVCLGILLASISASAETTALVIESGTIIDGSGRRPVANAAVVPGGKSRQSGFLRHDGCRFGLRPEIESAVFHCELRVLRSRSEVSKVALALLVVGS